MFSLYHGESAGMPNMPIDVIRYNKSNADNTIKRVVNVSVNSKRFLFKFKIITLKPLPITPIHETVIQSR